MSHGRFSFFAIAITLLCLIAGIGRDLQSRTVQSAQAQTVGQLSTTPAQTLLATRTATPAYTPTPNVEITMLFLGATNTSIAIAKTEAESHAQRETQASQDLATAAEFTRQTQVSEALLTQAHWNNSTSTSIAATATSGAATLAATQMQGSAVQATMTQRYWDDVTATQLANTQEIERSALAARKTSIWGLTVMLLCAGLLGLAWLGVRVWRALKLARAEYIQSSKLEHDAQGRLPVVSVDALGRNNKLVNANLAHRAVVDPEGDDLSTEQALINKQMNNELEATRALVQSPALTRKLLNSKAAVTTEAPMPEANTDIARPLMPLLGDRQTASPSWSLMENWDGKGSIPIGIDTQGRMVRVDIRMHYHFGVFGATGEGKSRYLLRPFIAALLANNQRVVIIGKTGDFWPFANHPNCKLIAVRRATDPAEAERYAGYLKRIVDEMDVRDEFLTSHRVSTWERANHENTFVVLDEVGNALSKMPDNIEKQAYRWIDALAREGRKAGFNLITASQRAVGFKSIVEQMRRVVFHVEDADTSRIALGFPGAEALPTNSGQFFAKLGTVSRCLSFDPADDQLTAFLQAHPVRQLEPIDWIEGTATDVEPAPQVEQKQDVEHKIREVLIRMIQEDNVSMRQVEREVWGQVRGGQYFSKVQEIYKQLKANGTTTGNMPDSGAIAA